MMDQNNRLIALLAILVICGAALWYLSMGESSLSSPLIRHFGSPKISQKSLQKVAVKPLVGTSTVIKTTIPKPATSTVKYTSSKIDPMKQAILDAAAKKK